MDWLPSWSRIIASSTSDMNALGNFLWPVVQWTFTPIIVIGVTALLMGILVYMVKFRH